MDNVQQFVGLDLFSSLDYFAQPQYSPESTASSSDADASFVSAGDTATSPKSFSARPLPSSMTTQDVMQTLWELESFVTPAKSMKPTRSSTPQTPASQISSPVPSTTSSPASSDVSSPVSTASTPSPKPKSDKKPGLSYVGLIAKALLSAPNQKMLLHDIYHYITKNYPYFKEEDGGWKNSVRHNLSLNECFIKAGKADVGKGNYWTVHPACVEDFTSGNYKRTRARRRAQRYTAYAKAIALGQSYGTTAYSQPNYNQQPAYYHPYAMPLYANAAPTVPTLSLPTSARSPYPTPYMGAQQYSHSQQNYVPTKNNTYGGVQSHYNTGMQAYPNTQYPMSMPSQPTSYKTPYQMTAPTQYQMTSPTPYQMTSPTQMNNVAYPPNVTVQSNGFYPTMYNTR